MQVTNKEYSEMTKKRSPNTKIIYTLPKAFFIGGLICVIGEAFSKLYIHLGITPDNAVLLVAVTLILISALLTGFKLYDKIAKHGGAGTLVPITGFANSVVAPALEFKTEGFILGVGAKMFVIAGPVIVYGTAASVIYGIVLFIMNSIK